MTDTMNWWCGEKNSDDIFGDGWFQWVVHTPCQIYLGRCRQGAKINSPKLNMIENHHKGL
jgi:hypothetical protein